MCNLEEMGVCRKKDGASENSQVVFVWASSLFVCLYISETLVFYCLYFAYWVAHDSVGKSRYA